MCLVSYAKFKSLAKSVIFVSCRKPTGSAVAARGLAVNRLLGGEKILLHIVWYALVFIIIITSGISSSSISFVVQLNSLCLNP